MTNTNTTVLQIEVNGAKRLLTRPMSVADLVAELQLDTRRVAIERNRSIVPRSAYATTSLAAEDRIEIVGFVGGG